MMESNEDIIPFEEPMKNFIDHVGNNERIMFSARFGDGKTYFINEFKKKRQDSYLFITIYPTNYAVEENKDIFELIKRDIIYQLCNKGVMTDEIDIDAIIKSIFNQDTINELISLLSNIGGMINLPGSNLLFKLIEKLIQGRLTYQKNKETINKYIHKFTQLPGIYEHDCYTQLITAAINNYQIKRKKKTILIIEDLDRIDPAHVFRILNIFSAHIDRHYTFPEQNYPNKFGFDTIIIVCCYQNMKNIFHHIYGPETDFKGYIQKFITQNIFNYSLNEVKNQYFFNKTSEITKINEIVLKGITELKNKVDQLSIREVTSLFKNLDKQIKHVKIPVFSDYKANVLGPLSRFIAILKGLNLDKEEYNSVLNFLGSTYPNELTRTIGPLWGIPIQDLGGKNIYFLTNKYRKDIVKLSIYPIIIEENRDKEEVVISDVKISINKVQQDENGELSPDFMRKIFEEVEKYIII